ncbi:MAG: hypothetical protein IKM85_06710 [Bacteroidales bacterium]|nr:hypothetical protein [Bacteroidales bacterium]
MDLLQKIYDATNGGLDIILHYYPQAADSVDKPNKGFSLREETAPSAFLKRIKGVWRVTDFGEENKARSPIDVVMREENVEFNEALSLLASRHGISDRLDESRNRALVETRPATDDEPDGHFDFETHPFTAAELRTLGNGVKEEHATALSFYAVTWYSFTKNRKTTTIRSTDDFPVFMRECHTQGESFFKILKPLEPKKEYRFMYLGKKEPDYVNGLFELRKAHAKFVADHENDEVPEGKHPPTKLPECVICSGERDAVCCLSRGCQPVWLNSETAELGAGVFHSLLSMCEKVCNLPDIDATGRARAKALALKYLDIATIELPESLMQHRDRRGNPCKDMRDWCEFHSRQRDFQDLVAVARQCKFWYQEKDKKTGEPKTKLDVVSLLWFLELNGYARLVDPQTMNERIIRVADDNIVTEVTANSIRDFLNEYCRSHYISLDVQRSLIASRFIKSIIDSLPVVNGRFSFRNHTADAQYFRFLNDSIEVTADQVAKYKKFHIWDKAVCRHRFKRLAPSFTVIESEGRTTLQVLDDSSLFFRFCINSSRLYWRNEFDFAKTVGDTTYQEANKFKIDGKYLTDDEREEQMRCLLAKMYAIGYLLHSGKDPSRPYIVWVLENAVLNDDQASGGSGKSFIAEGLKILKNTVMLPGRAKNLTENQHVLERVDEDTDLVFVDDPGKYFDFDFFYTMATGNTIVNEKHVKSKEISFENSPKVIICSNYAPNSLQDSTLRRLLFVTNSDYYHKKTDFNDYEETRTIADDFGKNLFWSDYTDDEWNADINFLIDCLQLFLRLKAENKELRVDTGNIYRRINLSIMGDQFNEWAEGYFLPDGPNLDVMIKKSDVFADFVSATGLKLWSQSKFSRALQSFCRNNSHYIECLNPPELCPASTPGRIVRKVANRTEYYIYMKTVGNAVQERFKDEFDTPAPPI